MLKNLSILETTASHCANIVCSILKWCEKFILIIFYEKKKITEKIYKSITSQVKISVQNVNFFMLLCRKYLLWLCNFTYNKYIISIWHLFQISDVSRKNLKNGICCQMSLRKYFLLEFVFLVQFTYPPIHSIISCQMPAMIFFYMMKNKLSLNLLGFFIICEL